MLYLSRISCFASLLSKEKVDGDVSSGKKKHSEEFLVAQMLIGLVFSLKIFVVVGSVFVLFCFKLIMWVSFYILIFVTVDKTDQGNVYNFKINI